MCGIWFFLNLNNSGNSKHIDYQYYSNLNSVRGPDDKHFIELPDNFGKLGFYRLKINDLSNTGNQPFVFFDTSNKKPLQILCCNGEIYNHKELERNFGIDVFGKSDCEIILHLYQIMSFPDLIRILDGVFFIILIDFEKKITFAGRDFGGRRSAFIGTNYYGIFMSSFLKGIDFCDNAKQFPPAHWWCSSNPEEFNKFYELPNKVIDLPSKDKIKELFFKAVKKRVHNTDRKLGFFLSGGLDSSLVCAVANKILDKRLITFSVGTHYDAPDLKAARQVANFLNAEHHELIITQEDIISYLPDVINCLESYCCTTIRASIGQYLLSKYISEKTDVKVVLSGEFADEIFGSYFYFELAPNNYKAKQETKRLLENIHYFDCLRAERTTSFHGLEVRTPFADKDFLEYIYNIDYSYKSSRNQIEKKILRDAFKGFLPENILYRKKNGFSDAVGYDLRTTLIDYSEKNIKDYEYQRNNYLYLTPKTKEQFLYRKIFHQYFRNYKIIPEQWMPRWTNNKSNDPSGIHLQSLIN